MLSGSRRRHPSHHHHRPHVPHDICVTGFDDSYVAICNNPTLTTIRLPIEDMANAATQMLLSGRILTGHRRRFPVELILRDSTIRHPIRKHLVATTGGGAVNSRCSSCSRSLPAYR